MANIIINGNSWNGLIAIKEYMSKNPALSFSNPTQGPIAVLTVNVPSMCPNEIAFPEYKQKDVMQQFIDRKVCMPPHRYVPSGYVSIPICSLLPDWKNTINKWNKGYDIEEEEEDISEAAQQLKEQQYDTEPF